MTYICCHQSDTQKYHAVALWLNWLCAVTSLTRDMWWSLSVAVKLS